MANATQNKKLCEQINAFSVSPSLILRLTRTSVGADCAILARNLASNAENPLNAMMVAVTGHCLRSA